MLAMEPKAHGDIQAVHGLLSVMALRCCDVDGAREEDGDRHSDDRSGSARQREGRKPALSSSSQNQARTGQAE